MISSLLIANRGEIACRIIRTARHLGIRTVAVFSEADADAPHVRQADQAVCIGASPARDSYLNMGSILDAARLTGVEAVHPGYGFLSENPEFARAVIAAGLTWVGPPPAAIEAMGLKDAAKRLMSAAGLPVTPGYDGADQTEGVLLARAAEIGWPVLIKAVAGGGGKGMRASQSPVDFPAALAAARREGRASFGDDRVLLERLIPHPRHIEVQIFGDRSGQIVHLFERDCSLQRRHQKIIEEAPAPGLDEPTREALCDMAVRAAKAVDYVGAGTVEFIADGSRGLAIDRIWFMEMNTRLQVEHPVTEAITGVDLVEWQLRVACGQPLPLSQQQIVRRGHAMEARLCAEDPRHGFRPSVGVLTHLALPKTARVDTGVEQGGRISPHYDSMVAKVIVHADTREAAARRLAAACASVESWPVKTNAAFLARCAADEAFIDGHLDTGFIERRLDDLTTIGVPTIVPGAVAALAARASARWSRPPSLWDDRGGLTGFRLNAPRQDQVRAFVDGVAVSVPLGVAANGSGWIWDDDAVIVFDQGSAHRVTLTRTDGAASPGLSGDGRIIAPMPGKIVSVSVNVADAVVAGQPLIVLEAMKMEHGLTAPGAGVVEEISVGEGDQVDEGRTLIRLKFEDARA